MDELDHTFHDWRGHGNGEPSRYYIRGGNIGFHNTPSITSSGSYPQVQLEVQKYVTLQSSTNFDGQIPRGALDAWTFHVLEEWGVMKGDERIEYFRQRKYEGFMLLVESITGRLSKYHPKIIKGLAMGQGRRII